MMFDKLGQIAGLMKNAGKIKEGVQEMQRRLAAARFVGEAGGGQVQCTVDGQGQPVKITIAPSLMQTGDVEMLEDLVLAGITKAIQLSRDGMKKEVESMSAAYGLPGIGNLFGGGM